MQDILRQLTSLRRSTICLRICGVTGKLMNIISAPIAKVMLES